MSTAKKLMGTTAAGNIGAWDLSYAYYDPATNPSLAGASYIGSFSVATEDTSPFAVAFKTDGTKMYVLGDSGNDVNEYSLSKAWDISTASYVQSFSVAAQDSTPRGLAFKPDGTKMYVTGTVADRLHEYALATPWDVSTASFVQNISVGDSSPWDVFFRDDGIKLYVLGASSSVVREFSLGTAWDISTASYVQNFSVSTQDTSPSGLSLSPDGTKMYVTGEVGNDINEYTLSTPWDVSTASFVGTLDVSNRTINPNGLFFSPDMSNMYITGYDFDSVMRYFLGGFSVIDQEASPSGLSFHPDGTKMYVIGSSGDDINEYSLSTAWDVSTASFVQNFSVSAQETSPSGLFFHPDGTKMYVIGYSGDDINEYSLSTAWDVSTASFVQNFSVSAQETSPSGLFFHPDGTKMYVIGYTGDDVNEYSLSTAWDISSASYVQNFYVGSHGTTPQDLFFHPNGTKMYTMGSSADYVSEYSLSTAWDISSASYVQNFFVGSQEPSPNGLFFHPDGTKMYVVGGNYRRVNTYTLGVQE